MGNYNPHAPAILGNEWVPLRDPGFKPDNVTEYGTAIHIDNSATAITGYYYISDFTPNAFNGAVELISVYPTGMESETGPIQQVVIPVSALGVTGTGISGTVAGLQNPSDGIGVNLAPGNGTQRIGLNFDVASYQGQLQGKRILNVELLLQASGLPSDLDNVAVFTDHAAFTSGTVAFATGITGPLFNTLTTDLISIPFGDVNLYWAPSVTATTDPAAFPYRWEELNNFSTAANLGTRMQVLLVVSIPSTSNTSISYGYAAMRVTYCEEKRVLYGGNSIHAVSTASNYTLGPRPVQLLTPQFTAPGALPAGDYTVTLSHRLYGSSSAYEFSRTAPKMYGIQEYLGLSTQRGRLIRQSLIPGDVFTMDNTDFLPQLTLHTSSGIVTGSHSYGALVTAPVYGAITAAQSLTNLGYTGSSYPWIRFYARHFSATNALTLTNGFSSVSIAPADFNALPEIADGWKEVTLQFTGTIPSATGVNLTWTFSSPNELAGSRWEILGVRGVSANSPQNIGPSTYQAPSGSTQALTWSSPSITGVAADSTADLVLFLGEVVPAVPGLAVTQQTLPVAPISDQCGVTSDCVPTGIRFNRVAFQADGICDTMSQVVAPGGFGSATSGQVYSLINTAADFQKDGSQGIITPTSMGNARAAYTALPGTGARRHSEVTVSFSSLPVTGNMRAGVIPRMVDTQNYYAVHADVSSSGALVIRVDKIVANVFTPNIATFTTPWTIGPNQKVRLVTEVIDSTIRAYAVPLGTESLGWQVSFTDASLGTGSSTGLYVRNEGNLGISAYFDDFQSVPLELTGGQLEIQRMDDYDSTWQTVALYSMPACVTSFDDFEARVGVMSSYRTRYVNAQGFPSVWSSTLTGTISAPGVTVGGTGAGVLIFTSNRDTAAALAYTMVWDGQPVETFIFPEASEQVFQRLYGRDFQVAFRPLERGGEQFDRVMLVQAAAVTRPRLGNMKSLRDLAWENLPYVCVRDELGNRWYANVMVPGGSVENKRRLYLAQIRVTEVTATPAPAGQ